MGTVKMEYVGPGVKPDPIYVEESEVDALSESKLWKKAGGKKSSAAKPEEDDKKGDE